MSQNALFGHTYKLICTEHFKLETDLLHVVIIFLSTT